jgi:rhamnopyranosyl-N-acetylglucosaminyl-diphospho-decaprenol beta-1,3/1,4-galactofuranosyltransferase
MAPAQARKAATVTRDEQVVAVVVTWNRRDLLAESLNALAAQTRPPDEIVVVDNASTDGTGKLLRESFSDVTTVTAVRNTGGAGGFAIGLDAALRVGADAIWLMDDDTVPEPGALGALLDARRYYSAGTPAIVASRVLWTDGRDHPMNTPRVKPGVKVSEFNAARDAGCIPIRSASFVSILVDADTVRQRGLPIADYFLWNDDFEFTTRLLRGRRGIACPQSVVVHKTKTFGSTDADPGDRFFFEVRNKIWLFARSRGLSPAEKVVYAGSTLRRWGRTFAASSNRVTLAKALGRGLKAGVTSKPRPTREVMAGTVTDAGSAEDADG